eukprot:3694690-Amphidinium_carterae.2
MAEVLSSAASSRTKALFTALSCAAFSTMACNSLGKNSKTNTTRASQCILPSHNVGALNAGY